MTIWTFIKKTLLSVNFWIVITFSSAMLLGLPTFIFQPDKDLWFVSSDSKVNVFTRARVSLLLWRGADLSYRLGENKSTLAFALNDKNKWLLEKFSDYADESEKKYAVDFALHSEDEEFIEFVMAHFKVVDEN